MWTKFRSWIRSTQETATPDELLIRSYRFLRLGTAVLGLSIIVSMLLERRNSRGFEHSISAYYYTASRPVFTGALVAIGASLLAIKGRTTWEDIFLNLAGMMAPLVPFIPPGQASLKDGSVLSDDGFPITVDQRRELLVNSLFTVALVAAVGLFIVWRISKGKDEALHLRKADRVGLGIAAGVIGAGMTLYFTVDLVRDNAHMIAASIMFVFVWGAVMNVRVTSPIKKYRDLYRVAAWWMPLAAVAVGIVKLLHRDWQHTVLVLELLELLPFMYFWLVQTAENWKVGLVTEANKSAA